MKHITFIYLAIAMAIAPMALLAPKAKAKPLSSSGTTSSALFAPCGSSVFAPRWATLQEGRRGAGSLMINYNAAREQGESRNSFSLYRDNAYIGTIQTSGEAVAFNGENVTAWVEVYAPALLTAGSYEALYSLAWTCPPVAATGAGSPASPYPVLLK